MPKLLLLDGLNLAHRLIRRTADPRSADGRDVTGVSTFAVELLRIFDLLSPTHAAFAWDAPRQTYHRRVLYPEYKANRDEGHVDPAISQQLTLVRELVESSGLPILTAPGGEADDVIASATARFSPYASVVIAAKDKDMHQLVTRSVRIFDGERLLGIAEVEEYWGCPLASVIDVQTLSGDAGDNVPGVPGVGLKRAASLVKRYGSAERAQRAWTRETGKLSAALRAFDVSLGRQLVELRKDLPLANREEAVTELDQLAFSGFDPRLSPFLAKLGIEAPRLPLRESPTPVAV